MKTINVLVKLLDRFIWIIGMMTIISYTHEHWPKAYGVSACILIVAFGIWYIWKFFVQPFREGLNGQ